MKIEDLPLPSRIIKLLLLEECLFKITYAEELLEIDDKTLLKVPRLHKDGIELLRKVLDLVFKKEKPKQVNETAIIIEMRSLFFEYMASIRREMNELRTITCEQYRLLQSIQLEKSPDGVLRRINDKVPGFAIAMHDLYKKLEE